MIVTSQLTAVAGGVAIGWWSALVLAWTATSMVVVAVSISERTKEGVASAPLLRWVVLVLFSGMLDARALRRLVL